MNILTLLKPDDENLYVLDYAKKLAKVLGFQFYYLSIIPVSGDIPQYEDGTVLDHCADYWV